MVFLYFAYGSNLLKQRLLHSETATKTLKGIGRLKDHEVKFKGRITPGWKGHSATIEESPGSDVWGVVWELDDELGPALDRQEWSYDKISVPVVMESGITVKCVTYQMSSKFIQDEVGLPSPYYLDIIQRGAKQNDLPLKYREWLGSYKHNNCQELSPIYLQVIQLIRDDPSCNYDIDRLTGCTHIH